MQHHQPNPTGSLDTALKCVVAVGPDIDVESWRLALPARGGCYLMQDELGQPVLLATSGNLRRSITHRLNEPETEAPTQRVDLRQVVRRVLWREAPGRFEQDWVYLAHAKQVLSAREYQQALRRWRCGWVHVDPDAAVPRITVSDKPDTTAGVWLGPFADQRTARRYVSLLVDVFDLCRYEDELARAPRGQACAYKEMGRCPAPCDGTVPLAHYHRQIRQAIAFAQGEKDQWFADAEAEMKTAASELAFERAALIKSKLEHARALGESPFDKVTTLNQLRWLLLEAGRTKQCLRAFVLHPRGIVFLGEMQRRDRPAQVHWLSARCRKLLDEPAGRIDAHQAQNLNLACWHLLRDDRAWDRVIELRKAADPQKLTQRVEQVLAQSRSPTTVEAASNQSVHSSDDQADVSDASSAD